MAEQTPEAVRRTSLPIGIRLQAVLLKVWHVAIVVAVVGGPFVPVTIMVISDVDYFGTIFGWQLGGTAVLVLGALAVGGRLDRNVQEARFAQGRRSIGRIVEVITEHVYDGESEGRYVLVISAQVPGPMTLHRRIVWSAYGPAPRIGETVRFRHNTVDPENRDDVLFDGLGATSRAETPVDEAPEWVGAPNRRTRIRMRWWSWVEDVAVRVIMIGIIASALMVPVSVGLIAWSDGGSPLVLLIGLWTFAVGSVPFGMWVNGLAGRRLTRVRVEVNDMVRRPST